MSVEDIPEEVKNIIEWCHAFNYKAELDKINKYEDTEEEYNIINGVNKTPINNNYINNTVEKKLNEKYNIDKLIDFINKYDNKASLMWCYNNSKIPISAHKDGYNNNNFLVSSPSNSLGILLYNIFVIDFDNIKDVEKFKFLFPDDFNNNTIQEQTKKGAHFYFLRPVIFDELKIFHRTKIFKDENNNKLDIDLINRYENGTRGIINIAPSLNKKWIVEPWTTEIKEPTTNFINYIIDSHKNIYDDNKPSTQNPKPEKETQNKEIEEEEEIKEIIKDDNIYNYDINELSELDNNDKKYFVKGRALYEFYNISFEYIATNFLISAPWFAYFLLIPNNGNYQDYFKIAYSCYNEAIKTNDKLILFNDDNKKEATEEEHEEAQENKEVKIKNTKKRIYERFIKYFLDFAALSPYLKHKNDIKNNKDIIIKDLKNKKIDVQKYQYLNINILRKYARASTPDFFNKYDPYTLLKSHFTLNFNVLSDFKIYYQNCNYLCQEGTQYEFNILNDISKVIAIISRMGSGKTVQIFKLIKYRGYKRTLFISPRIAFAYAIQNDFKDEGLIIDNYKEITNNNELNKVDNLVISLESLYKLNDDNIYDCIIIDESESVLNQFKSPTHKNNINECNNKLMNFINNCKCVIFSDALLSPKTINYIKYIDGHKSIHINTVKTISNKTAYEVKGDKKLNKKLLSPMLTKIKEYIKNDDNIYICSSSKTRLLKYKNKLEMEGQTDKIISDYLSPYNSIFYFDSMGNELKNESLKDINKYWKNKKLVGTSPLITCGNSYNENEARKKKNYEPHFKEILLLSSPGSCCVRDSIQQTKRIRYTKTNNLYFNVNNIHLFKNKGLFNILSSRNFEDRTEEKKEIFKKLLKKCDCDNINDYYEELIDKYYDYSDQLKEVIKYSILEEGISDILYKKMLFLYLKIDGYNINELETKEEEED